VPFRAWKSVGFGGANTRAKQTADAPTALLSSDWRAFENISREGTSAQGVWALSFLPGFRLLSGLGEIIRGLSYLSRSRYGWFMGDSSGLPRGARAVLTIIRADGTYVLRTVHEGVGGLGWAGGRNGCAAAASAPLTIWLEAFPDDSRHGPLT